MEREKILKNITIVTPFIFLFFFISGALLHLDSEWRDFVLTITPVTLIMSLSLATFVSGVYKDKMILSALLLIALIGYISEVIGVKTGLIFGNYSYNEVLGPKVFEVPFIIALNWAFVIFGALTLLNIFTKNRYLLILLTPIVTVLFDIILEPVARDLGYWEWVGVEVPLYNYLSWFMISLISVLILDRATDITKINQKVMIIFSSLFIAETIFFLMILAGSR